MSKTIALKLTEEEIEMLIDALEVDQDGYVLDESWRSIAIQRLQSDC